MNSNILVFPRTRQKAEASVLAILLFCPSKEDRRLANTLSPDDFHDQQLALIFEAMQSLMDQGEATDIIMVGERLEEMGKLDAAGGRRLVMELAGCIYREESMTEQIKVLRP